MLTKITNKESGNILLYILGAIALLGLLIIAVKGSSTPGSNIKEEELMLRVSEVQQYGRELEQAVSYILQNGFSETDIRFAHPDASSAYGVITDIPARQIFSREGGGATYREPPNDIQTTATDWHFTGRNGVTEVGSHIAAGGNLISADLIGVLSNVSKNFCLLVNEQNNIQNISNNPPQDDNNIILTDHFVGNYSFGATLGDAAPLLTAGKLEGCIEGENTPPAGTYHYYRVLLAR